jgi:hypothetical protein
MLLLDFTKTEANRITQEGVSVAEIDQIEYQGIPERSRVNPLGMESLREEALPLFLARNYVGNVLVFRSGVSAVRQALSSGIF